jgi:cellulose biosynthesis protein BcsQ
VKIVAVTNIKGGVGKTTAAVNLAYLCASGGRTTLLWDLDAQGGATYLLQGEAQSHGAAKKLIAGKYELPELVFGTGYAGLDLLPAHFSYRNFAVHLARRGHPTERLLRMSRALRDIYDVLLLDCPAGISLLTENVLRAADLAVVPLVPSPLSVRMVAELREFVAREQWSDLELLPFFSMVDRRRSLHREFIESARTLFPGVLATEVPYRSEIERMSQERAPLPVLAPHGPGAAVYQALWAEIEPHLGDRRTQAPGPAPAYPGAA